MYAYTWMNKYNNLKQGVLEVASDSAGLTSSGSKFQSWGALTAKARSPLVLSGDSGTASRALP